MKPVDLAELDAIVEQLKNSSLDEASQAKLRTVVESLRYMKELVSEEGATGESVRARFFERYNIIPDSTDG